MKKISALLLTALAALGFAASGTRAAETYVIDAVHSSVAFSIRHFVSKVPGKFNQFAGTISFDAANPAASSVEATIQIASIDTANQKRDDHLRNADFFDAPKFPTMKFKSRTWKKTGENTFNVVGDLTLKDVTKEVTLKVTSLGFGPGMGGAQLSGWEATTKINKRAFNVKGPAMLEAALGDEIAITINIEAAQKKS